MNKKAFTLIEIMIGILIVSIVIIVGFQALNAIMIGKVKLIETTNISKEAFKFSQKFFEEIKKSGTIDYEEYFNRKVVGNTECLRGHYKKNTDYGNTGNKDGFYYCRSGNGLANKMGTGGCLEQKFNNSGKNQNGEKQRFGQYSFQFRDYNSNYNGDLGDENNDGKIYGDDDDLDLGIGPEVFESGTGVTEIYLISADKRKRTIFRWNVVNDPDSGTSMTCDFSNQRFPTGSGCLGTIEFLKLDGKDWGFNHSKSGSGYSDGIVDTWIVNKDFVENAGETGTKIANGNLDKYFIPLFPNSINVKEFDLKIYPNNDRQLAWKTNDYDISPYLQMKMILTPSWKVKRKIKGTSPEFEISTTVNLTPLFSR